MGMKKRTPQAALEILSSLGVPPGLPVRRTNAQTHQRTNGIRVSMGGTPGCAWTKTDFKRSGGDARKNGKKMSPRGSQMGSVPGKSTLALSLNTPEFEEPLEGSFSAGSRTIV